jgi:signal transduction histidine kinase
VVLTRIEWATRYDFPDQHLHWSANEWAYFAPGWASVALGQLAGLWLWWRAPRISTGRWLWLAGVSLALWFVGGYWPSPWGMQLGWSILVMLPALAMALLGWPTGRPGRRVVRWIVALAVADVAEAVVVNLFSRPNTKGAWPVDPTAPFSVGWVVQVANGVAGWLLYFLPATAVIVVLVRRRLGLPRSARRLVTPITVTGVLVAGCTMFSVAIGTFGQNLTWDYRAHHSTALGTVTLAVSYAQVGVAAIGLLVAFAYRRRAVQGSDRHLELALAPASAIDASAALARLLDDQSARVLYPRSNGAWVDAHGRAVTAGGAHRMLTPIEGRSGSALAAIDTDARVGAHPSLLEIAAATIATGLANERASAMAKARSSELAALQLALLDTTDAARRSLERDLHDGAQQRLVGATLAASLAARGGNEAVDEIRAEIEAVRAVLLDVIEDRVPTVLVNGLAGALATLAATSPLDAETRVRGDLGPDDPLTRTLWLVASEAMTNAVKHAHASSLRLELAVDPACAILQVTDDGCGGMGAPPLAIASRVDEAGGRLTFSSPAGAGTDLVVTFGRTGTAVVA